MQNMEQIYEKYFQTVNKYLLCLTHNDNLAEEFTQETFYKAIKKINKFKGECEISVWLCQIAKNLWYDECRKNKKMLDMNDEKLFDLQILDNLEENLLLKERKTLLYTNLKTLDDLTKEVVYLRIFGELSFNEIATILNKTSNWARVTFYRGKEKLKEGVSYEGEKM